MSISPVRNKSRIIILKIFVALALPLLVAQGCGNNKAKAPKEDINDHLEHFWDGVDLSALGDDAVEQRLVDFIYLTINAAPDRRRQCWQTIARIFPDEQPNRLVADYLVEPDSPLYAPAMLEEYLAAIAALYDEGAIERARVDYLLEGIRKNKTGEVIADLDLIIAADGRRTTLHALIAGHESLILFYDPTCAECTALIDRLGARSATRRVVAISVTGEAKTLPSGWHSCLVADEAQLDERFFLPRLPQLYHTTPTATIQ